MRWVSASRVVNTQDAGLLVSWVTGYLCGMGVKMTFELPADLAKQLKVRAAEEGVKLKDLVAEACRAFMASRHKRTKGKAPSGPYPILKGGRPAKPEEEMTPDRVAEILWGSGE